MSHIIRWCCAGIGPCFYSSRKDYEKKVISAAFRDRATFEISYFFSDQKKVTVGACAWTGLRLLSLYHFSSWQRGGEVSKRRDSEALESILHEFVAFSKSGGCGIEMEAKSYYT